MPTTDIDLKIKSCEDQLSSPDIYSDPVKLKKISKELHRYKLELDLTTKIATLKEAIKQNELLTQSSDTEFKELLKLEASEFENELMNAEKELQVLLIPEDPMDFKNAIIEIRAGTGGDEASIFCADLYRMYSRYCTTHSLTIELLDQTFSSTNGFKEIIFKVSGETPYKLFKNESGVHRVQRIPSTETAGRIHTSAASVVVLPEIEIGEVNIQDKDIRIDVYRSSGPGGQSVNTTDSAVRITHIPTNIVVTCQDGKSQLKNKASALTVLASKLYELEKQKVNSEISDIRKDSIKTGDRSDKIKTYNFPQNRVTDHRIKKSWYKLDTIMEGYIDEILKTPIIPNDNTEETED